MFQAAGVWQRAIVGQPRVIPQSEKLGEIDHTTPQTDQSAATTTVVGPGTTDDVFLTAEEPAVSTEQNLSTEPAAPSEYGSTMSKNDSDQADSCDDTSTSGKPTLAAVTTTAAVELDVVGVAEDQPQDIPQSEKLDPEQVLNNAGGYTYTVTDENRLRRFLCLGTEKGSYYAGEAELGLDNVLCVHRLIAAGKGGWVVHELRQFSVEGRTAKQNPLMLTLAMCARQETDIATKRAAYSVVNDICRIPTHLFMFINYCELVSRCTGWGRAHRRAVAAWYLQHEEDPQRLTLHVTKYKYREGWTHADALRLSHPKPVNRNLAAVFQFVTKGLEKTKQDFLPGHEDDVQLSDIVVFLQAVNDVKRVRVEKEVVAMIEKHRLLREHLPTEWLNSKAVWKALLEHMPLTATIRNLGKMSAIGAINQGSAAAGRVIKRLKDDVQLRRARIHPFNVLVAMYTYKSGHGDKGKLSWKPNRDIVKALDEAFYKCFKLVEATNKRFLLAVDVSASMTWHGVNGNDLINAREAAAALAMVTLRTEPNCDVVGFCGDLKPIDIEPCMMLPEVIMTISKMRMGATDCARPMTWAEENKKKYDVFVVYTDNETWFGQVHPAEALRRYRKQSGIWDSKLVVLGLTATEFSIADPNDPGMFDMAGFDSNGPEIMRNFVTGNL